MTQAVFCPQPLLRFVIAVFARNTAYSQSRGFDMDLDRNINPSGKGKYALINMRKIQGDPRTAEDLAAAILANPEAVEFGEAGGPDEFWLIKLRDKYSKASLEAYAAAVGSDDPEFADAVWDLSRRAGKDSPFCKSPD